MFKAVKKIEEDPIIQFHFWLYHFVVYHESEKEDAYEEQI